MLALMIIEAARTPVSSFFSPFICPLLFVLGGRTDRVCSGAVGARSGARLACFGPRSGCFPAACRSRFGRAGVAASDDGDLSEISVGQSERSYAPKKAEIFWNYLLTKEKRAVIIDFAAESGTDGMLCTGA